MTTENKKWKKFKEICFYTYWSIKGSFILAYRGIRWVWWFIKSIPSMIKDLFRP